LLLAASAPAFAKTETVTGKIVDMNCYMKDKTNNAGQDHKMPADTKDCATDCAKTGAALALLMPYKYNLTEILWAFSIWLEAVAILPQLFMLQRTGEAETITTHYLFALGLYRAMYIPNWIYRYFAEGGHFDPIAVVAGIIQTILYSDFFWIYYTKVLQGKKFNLPV